jgi:hypothetical protein
LKLILVIILIIIIIINKNKNNNGDDNAEIATGKNKFLKLLVDVDNIES